MPKFIIKFITKFLTKNFIVNTFVIISISTCGISVYNNIKNKNSLEMEKNVVVADDGKTLDNMIKDQEEKVKEGMLSVGLTPIPTYPNGNTEGKVMIKNPSKNTKNFKVKFILSKDNRLVYESGLIPPGSMIETAKLDKALPKGNYPAIAYFESYNSNNEKDGEVSFEINIKVLN